MRKIKFLAFALIAVFVCAGFTSCGDDDEEEVNGANPFIGTWVGTYEGDADAGPVVTMSFDGNTNMTASCPEEDWYFTGTYRYEYDADYVSTAARIAFVGRYVDGNGNNQYEDEDLYDDDADFNSCYFSADLNSLTIDFDGSTFVLYRQ